MGERKRVQELPLQDFSSNYTNPHSTPHCNSTETIVGYQRFNLLFRSLLLFSHVELHCQLGYIDRLSTVLLLIQLPRPT